MSPRPRTASDAEILAATQRVISSVGPRFTLADVAKEIGLAPATLIQRFGSKKGLILAALSSSGGAREDPFEAMRKNASGPLDAVFAYGDCFAQMAPSPEVLANHVAFLQMDLTDPEMHELSFAHAKATRTMLREGSARWFLRRDLETLIAPYRRKKRLVRHSLGEGGPVRRSFSEGE